MNFLSGVRQTVLFRSNCATYWQLQEKIVPNCQNDTSFSSSNHTTGKGGNFQNGSKPCSCMIRSQSPFSIVPLLGYFNCSEYGKNLRWICYGKQMFLFMAQLHLFRISLNLFQKKKLTSSIQLCWCIKCLCRMGSHKHIFGAECWKLLSFFNSSASITKMHETLMSACLF